MPKVALDPIYLCDLCGREFDPNEMGVGEYNSTKIQSITCDVWYCGIYTAKYICSRCDNRLQGVIAELNIEKKFTTSKWEKKK